MIGGRRLTIVPTLFEASAATEERLREASGHTLFMISHSTFADFVSNIAHNLGYGSGPASRLLLKYLLSRVLDEFDGEALPEAQRGGHLIDAIAGLFTTLDLAPSASRKPEIIKALFGETPKGVFLKKAWSGWRRMLRDEGLMTEGDILAEFVARPPNTIPRDFFRAEELVFSGFVNPPPIRAEAMLHASAITPATFSFEIYHPRADDLYEALSPFLNLIEKEGYSEGKGAPEIVFVEPPLAADPERSGLVDAIFGGGGNDSAEEAVSDNRIRIVGCQSRAEEVSFVTREIRDLMGKGARPGEIAIVAPEIEQVRPYLREAIVDINLPLAYHRSAPLLSAPSFHWLHKLLLVLEKGASASSLASLARSARPFAVGPANPDDPELVRTEARFMKHGIDIAENRDFAAALRTSTGGEADENDKAISALSSWIDWVGLWRVRRGFGEWLEYFNTVLEGMRLPVFASAHDRRHFTLSWHARETVRRIVGEWREMDGGPTVRKFGGVTFIRKLLTLMEAPISLRSNPEPESVAVLSPEEAARQAFEHLYFLDLNDGVFPGGGEDISLFSDAERKSANRRAGKRLFPGRRERYLLDKMAMTNILLKSERITLAHVYVDEKGDEQTPSLFIEEFRRFSASDAERVEPPSSIRNMKDWIVEAVRWLDAQDCAEAIGELPGPLRETLLTVLRKKRIEEDRAYFMLADDKEAGDDLKTAYCGRLDFGAENGSVHRLPDTYSVGWFESYAACPFRFFVERLLGIEAWESETTDPDPRTVGSAVHKLMVDVFKKGYASDSVGAQELEDFAVKRLNEILEEALRFARKETKTLIPFVAGRFAVRVRQLVTLWRDETAMVPPRYYEAWFGKDKEPGILGELKISQSDPPPFKIVGRIDRIDLGGGTARVVDYKSGGKSGEFREMLKPENFGRTSFQMPIYLMALKEAVNRDGLVESAEILDARYYLIGKPSDRPLLKPIELGGDFARDYFELDETRRAELRRDGRDNLADQLAEMVGKMRSGDFRVSPKSCEYCRMDSACRIMNFGKKSKRRNAP